MASTTNKKTCAKCNKGAGTAMCHGCEQSFCTKHFIEHRQELSQQMDNIGQEHDVLRRDLTNEQGTHPLLTRINRWEQECIIKIQTAAESARTDLQQLLNRNKNNLKTSVRKMTEELQSSRESDDYTELDIKQWTGQLQEFRKMLDSPTTVKLHYDNDARSALRLIKVTDQQSSDSFHRTSQLPELNIQISRNLERSVNERFVEVYGKIMLSEQGLVATRVGDSGDTFCVSGIRRYSSGVHYIRFRIEKVSEAFCLFFGIVNSSEKLILDILDSISRHGWWDFVKTVGGGPRRNLSSTRLNRPGDEVLLMLDCDNRRIQLEHHRTNTIVDMSIDLRECAFPWKIMVSLRNKDDCVRIVH